MTTPRALVVGGTLFPFHDLSEMEPAIDAAVGAAAEVAFTTNRDNLLDLNEYDFVVDYLTDSSLADPQRRSLLGFVADGGGYLGLHCAADLTSSHAGDGELDVRDEPRPALLELIGGHFLDHPERTTFGVDIVTDHPVTVGVDDFEVYDEPYQVAVTGNVTVLAEMDHPQLDPYPVVWTHSYGDGRVCYLSLGHTVESFEHDATRRLLRNAAGWLTS